MKQHIQNLTLAILFGLTQVACASAPQQAAAPAEPAKPALSAEAQAALAQAEGDIKAAKAAFTLWVPADNAMMKAQEAAKAFDSETVIKQAKIVSDLSKLSTAQTAYISTEMK